MKKSTRSTKLTLDTETVRKLGEQQLAAVGGGYTTYIYCQRTDLCPHTPACPQ
jgi:hypothetical protein